MQVQLILVLEVLLTGVAPVDVHLHPQVSCQVDLQVVIVVEGPAAQDTSKSMM